MTRRLRPATAREYARWLESANNRVDSGAPLSVDDLRALVAQPDQPGRLAARTTWWLEEMHRVTREQVQDKRPTDGVASTFDAWQQRQDMRAEQVESLADAHAEALMVAAAVVDEEERARLLALRKARPSRAEQAAGLVSIETDTETRSAA